MSNSEIKPGNSFLKSIGFVGFNTVVEGIEMAFNIGKKSFSHSYAEISLNAKTDKYMEFRSPKGIVDVHVLNDVCELRYFANEADFIYMVVSDSNRVSAKDYYSHTVKLANSFIHNKLSGYAEKCKELRRNSMCTIPTRTASTL